jgi:hypothetical protein
MIFLKVQFDIKILELLRDYEKSNKSAEALLIA